MTLSGRRGGRFVDLSYGDLDERGLQFGEGRHASLHQERVHLEALQLNENDTGLNRPSSLTTKPIFSDEIEIYKSE